MSAFQRTKNFLNHCVHNWNRHGIAKLLIAVGVGRVWLEPLRKALKPGPFSGGHPSYACVITSRFEELFRARSGRLLCLDQIPLPAHAPDNDGVGMTVV
jgi:hypothetical protein